MQCRSILILSALAITILAPLPASRAANFATADTPLPSIPAVTFLITSHSAIPDGKTPSTAAIQKTIAACTTAAGGHVEIPSGTFLTAPIPLASNLDLHLDAGATLLITANQADFPRDHSDILLDHMNISARLGLQIVHAIGIRFVDSTITPATGPALIQHDAQITCLDRAPTTQP